MVTALYRCVTLVIFSLFGAAALAGPLDPPATPASTPGPEPRTPISSVPAVISSAGSYYLSDDLTGVAGQGGITITADDVALDLMGFTLRGAPSSSNGITIANSAVNVVVRNGTISEWGSDGIDSLLGQRVILEDLVLRLNGGNGIEGSVRHTLRRCRFELNGSQGAMVDSESQVIDCVATLNGGVGISVGPHSVVRECASTNNGGTGISTLGDALVVDCTVGLVSGNAIAVGSGSQVLTCSVSSVEANGISFGSDCIIADNRVDESSNPQGATPGGLRSSGSNSLIERNTVINSDVGLLIEGEGNTIRDNIVRGNGGNYAISTGNHVELLISEIPEVIHVPAVLRLAGDLKLTSGDGGINITAPDVTVDLAGHSLDGDNISGAGIFAMANGFGAPIENIRIVNGTLRNWPGGGISLEVFDGIHVENVTVQDSGNVGILVGNESRVIACTARDNASDGVRTGEGAVVTDCVAEGNQLNGISVGDGSTVERCTGRLNVEAGILGGDNVVIRGCAGESNRFESLVEVRGRVPQGSPNAGHGIRARNNAVIENCTAELNDVAGIRALSQSMISNCTVYQNDGRGFSVNGSIVGCSSSENGASGFFIESGSTVNECAASRNAGDGFTVLSSDVTFSDCTSHFNDGAGFSIGSDSHISNCSATTNSGDGISGGSDSRIVNNHCQGNGNGAGDGAGIRTTGSDNHIDGNSVSENDDGIVVTNTGTVVVRNTSAGNANLNYDLSATSNFGTIVVLGDGGAFAGADPWANFEN